MDTGNIALMPWNGNRAIWLGNTETLSALWQTEKDPFEEVPAGIAAWALKELSPSFTRRPYSSPGIPHSPGSSSRSCFLRTAGTPPGRSSANMPWGSRTRAARRP
jgi:hypothetical protein